MFGVTVRRIQQLTQDGVISSVQVKGERGRRYEKDETVKTYIKYLSDKANGKATSKGVYHKNNCARKVSRLTKLVNGLA